jgi:hypothetical protein
MTDATPKQRLDAIWPMFITAMPDAVRDRTAEMMGHSADVAEITVFGPEDGMLKFCWGPIVIGHAPVAWVEGTPP